MRERISRPSSSVPNQCADDGVSRRAGKLIEAGSWGAIQGANNAKTRKIATSTTPIAASGLWRALPATRRRNEMAEADMNSAAPTIPQVGTFDSDESFQNRSD